MFFPKIDGRIFLKLDENKRLSIKRQKKCLHLIGTFRHFNKLKRFCRLRHFTMLRRFRLTDFAKLQTCLEDFVDLDILVNLNFVDFNILATLGMFCKMS